MTITYEGGTEQIRQIVHHHAVLRRGLERRAGTVCDAVASGVPCQRQVAILRGLPGRGDPAPCRCGGTHPLPGSGHPGPR